MTISVLNEKPTETIHSISGSRSVLDISDVGLFIERESIQKQDGNHGVHHCLSKNQIAISISVRLDDARSGLLSTILITVIFLDVFDNREEVRLTLL